MGKRIFVTGAAGFIGSAFVRKALKEGYQISVFDNFSFGRKEFLDSQVHIIEGDIRNRDLLDNAIAECQPDFLVHLAAIHFIPYCNQHPVEASEVNILGTMNVLDAAKKYGRLQKLFFASTAAVYPIMDKAISETDATGPMDIYGLTKLAGERLVHEFFLETHVPTVVCRFFNAFGPNETNMHIIPAIEQQIKEGSRVLKLGNLTPKRDFIHTYDMAEAMLLLFKKFDKGYDVFNLGRGKEYSMQEVVDAFAEALGETISVETDPSRVRKTERQHLLANISKLRLYTGWAPAIELKDGIKTLLKMMPDAK
jgi:UDP-glucose 4-epimerase